MIKKDETDEDVPTTVYVTKMQPFSSRLVDLLVREKAEGKQTLIGVGRVYSGTLRVGQKVQVIGPRHMF